MLDKNENIFFGHLPFILMGTFFAENVEYFGNFKRYQKSE